MNQQQFEEAIRKQNNVMVNLITSHKTAISSEVIFISLYTNDLTSLKLLSDHLNNNVKYHGKFFLRAQELGYILKMDNVELIDHFKNFIHPEILCYALHTAISKKEGRLCLQKSFKERMVKIPHIYLLLKTSIEKHGSEDPTTEFLLKYASKGVIRYIASDDKYDMIMITLILTRLLTELSIIDVYKIVSSQISNPKVKKYCLNIVSTQYKKKLKCYRS